MTTQFSSGSADEALAVGIQSDGKIVAAGESLGHFALARYNTDGTLDTTFGSDGKVTTHFTARSDDVAFATAIQADGKVVAAGRCALSFYYSKFALASTWLLEELRSRADAVLGARVTSDTEH